MRIYLTHYRTASTSYTELLEDIAYPQKVHIFPETMKKLETGIFSVAHRVLDKVLDPELMKQLKDNYVGKTAVIFSVGTTSFAGTKYDTGIKNRLNYNNNNIPSTATDDNNTAVITTSTSTTTANNNTTYDNNTNIMPRTAALTKAAAQN